ncbi:hypothetical protein BJF86_01355 [Serinicoccus sp. CNJ-927]|uniref:DUF2550 family protein n=1 Tax=unclassified Serinicoccus TaxID=2643101 RepID=UPI00096050FB|nr:MULTISPECIES: DUF2550 family protein [unclassified Serinicoccus]OLT19224.1 hypothetical protein BJF80_13085 [Serinicoccus sp. CUA-874]OLT43461.1 hypothetical protein BJF86_01355 [Serinicoccus sp. CNJ-927]
MTASLVLVLLAVVGGLVILGLGLFSFHLAAQRGSTCPSMPAAYRAGGDADAESDGWRRGTLRFTEDRLSLKGRGGLSVGPWMRGNLDLGVAGPLDPQDASDLGGTHLIRVPVRYGTARFELALGEQHYTALRSWVEAVPPGWNSQVA